MLASHGHTMPAAQYYESSFSHISCLSASFDATGTFPAVLDVAGFAERRYHRARKERRDERRYYFMSPAASATGHVDEMTRCLSVRGYFNTITTATPRFQIFRGAHTTA